MGTRYGLGLTCCALLMALGSCGRAGRSADQGPPDSTVINASAALTAAGESPSSPAADAVDACMLAKARDFIGKVDRPATRTALATAIGSHTVRWIRAGTAVTQDMQRDRLNVIIGDDGRILSVRCG
jgi:hypothetical protein